MESLTAPLPTPGTPEWARTIPLDADGRKAVVDHIYAAPLSDSAHQSVTEHTLVVDTYLLKLMANDPTLTELHVEHSFCTDVAIVALTDALMHNSVLTELHLSGNPLTDVAAVLLAHALTVNRTLRTLAVRDVSFTIAGLEQLGRALELNDTLTTLDIDRQQYDDDSDASHALHAKIQQLLHLHKYDSRVVAAVKGVYRAAAAIGGGGGVDKEEAATQRLAISLPFDVAYDIASTASSAPQDIMIPFTDHWALQFAFLSLEASAAAGASNDAPRSRPAPVLILDVDLTGRRLIFDDAVDAMVRCVRATHFAGSRMNVRLGVLRLGGTRISSQGIAQLLLLLEDEANLLDGAGNVNISVVDDVVLGDAGGDESAFPVATVERLRLGISLRNQPSVVKAAALRLFKEDPTFLHIPLHSPVVVTEDQESNDSMGGTPSASPPATQIVSDASVIVLCPLLLRSACVVSLEIPFGTLTHVSATLLGDVLASNKTLQVLDLRGNERLCRRGAVKPIANGILASKSIMSLNLSHTGMDAEGGCELANALLHNRSLTVLDISKNDGIHSGAVEAFLECVGVVNKVIRDVRLGDCGMSEVDVKRITHQIREAHEPYALRSVLTALHGIVDGTVQAHTLTEIRLGVKAVAQDALMRDTSVELLSKALIGCPHVRLIDISGNAVTSDGMRILFEQLCEAGPSSQLESLNVSRNPVGNVVEFGAACVHLLQRHPTLAQLDIRSLNLRAVGVQPILDALISERFPTTMRAIECDDNSCADWQLSVIQIILKSHTLGAPLRTFLKQLWVAIHHASYASSVLQPISFVNAKGVCRNRMSSLQFVDLCCELLQLCTPGFRKLNLSGNLLEDDSIETIARHLGRGMRVAAIDIRDNHITNRGVDALMVQVLRSDTIREIRVTGNSAITAEAERALQEALMIGAQPKFLKTALLHLCDPRTSSSPQQADEDGGDHVLDASHQLSDHLTDERFEMLLDALCANGASRMTSCSVANNHVGNRSLTKILDFAKSSDERQRNVVRHLISVSFRNTMIEGADVGAIAAELCHALPNVTSIDLSANDLCSNAAKVAAFEQASLPPLLAALEEHDHILSVHLEDCGLPQRITEPIHSIIELNNGGLKDVMRSLRSNDITLVALSLSDTGLTERNITALLGALSHHPVVQDLDLSGNFIGGDVASKVLLWCHRVVPPPPTKPSSPHRRATTTTNMSLLKLSMSGQPAPPPPPTPSSCRLRTLLLDRNHLCDEHAPLLHDMLLHSETLRCVSLLDNDLSPEVLYDRFVASRQLFLENNIITSLHVDAKNIDVFEHERFSERFVLNHAPLRHLKDVLPRLAENASDITVINLADTEGYLCNTVCFELSDVLLYNTHVHTLTLSNGAISDEGLLALCRSLTINRSVTTLDLSHNNSITDIGVSGLFDILCVNPVIREVHLEGNTQVGAIGIAKLMKALLSNHTVSIVALDPELSGAPRESAEAVDVALMLNRAHPNMKSFLLAEPEASWTELDVSNATTRFPGSTMLDDACAYLCTQLADNTTVEVLSLSNNDLTFDSCYSIARLLQTNRAITTLDLSNNGFGTGVFHLIKSLQVNDVVTTLCLEGCMASEMYLETIALLVDLNRETSMLKEQALLIMDDPSHHRVFQVTGDTVMPFNPTRPTRRKYFLDDEAMAAVDRVMKFSSAIQDVRFPHNHLTCAGLSWFSQNIAPRHHNILSMNLSHNHLDDDCVPILRTMVQESLKQLRCLDLSNNLLTEASIPQLIELMEVCPSIEVCTIDGHDGAIAAASREWIVFLELMNRIASDEARKQFIRASHNDPTLTTIDLSEYRADGRWRLNDHYMTLLGYLLPRNPHIRTLRMDDSAIDDDLLKAFCTQVLSKLQVQHNAGVAYGLVELSLSDNSIESVAVLTDALLNSSKEEDDDEVIDNSPEAQRRRSQRVLRLEILRLDGNKMILRSARCLAALMRQSTTLIELSVAGNAWGRTGGVLIQSALCNSSSLLSIKMEGPGIPNSIVDAALCTVASNALQKSNVDPARGHISL